MSSAVSAHPPPGWAASGSRSCPSTKDQQKARAFGLTSATGLVIGTVVGAGVFTMPGVLAVLAVLFGQLTRRVPDSDGGLYGYARHEFGDFAGLVGARQCGGHERSPCWPCGSGYGPSRAVPASAADGDWFAALGGGASRDLWPY